MKFFVEIQNVKVVTLTATIVIHLLRKCIENFQRSSSPPDTANIMLELPKKRYTCFSENDDNSFLQISFLFESYKKLIFITYKDCFVSMFLRLQKKCRNKFFCVV